MNSIPMDAIDKYQSVRKRLKGPVVPLNVCFNEHDAVDYVAMRRYVNWLCEQKVPVLLLTYGSSEFSSLTDAEIWRLTAELAEEIAGRALFIASTAWWWPGQCREFLKHAEQVGVDVVKVQIHPWIEYRREVLQRYFDQIQDASTIALMLWSVPAPLTFPLQLARELAQRPQFIGIKNDGDQFNEYYEFIRATADRNFAVVSGGLMRNFVFGHQIGSPAYLCPIAPFRPDIALRFYDLVMKRRYDEAWQWALRYEDVWVKTASDLDWLRSIKSAIHLHGLFPNDRLRSPRLSHDVKKRQLVQQCLEQVFGTVERVVL